MSETVDYVVMRLEPEGWIFFFGLLIKGIIYGWGKNEEEAREDFEQKLAREGKVKGMRRYEYTEDRGALLEGEHGGRSDDGRSAEPAAPLQASLQVPSRMVGEVMA